MKITSKVTGMKEVDAMINNMAKAPRVNVGTVAPGYNDKGEPIPRYANAQRKEGRDPFFFTASEDSSAMQELVRACDSWVEKKASQFVSAVKKLADLFPAAALRHIAEGKSESGPMKPLTTVYANRKRGQFGVQPILVRTGALRDAITSAWKIKAK